MNDHFITIFVAPPELAKALGGRYVCLVRVNNDERWFIDNSDPGGRTSCLSCAFGNC